VTTISEATTANPFYAHADELFQVLSLLPGEMIVVRSIDRRYLFIFFGDLLVVDDSPVRIELGGNSEHGDKLTQAGRHHYYTLSDAKYEVGSMSSFTEIWFGGPYFVRICASPAQIEAYYRTFSKRLEGAYVI
jgi:hypothetical protein